MAGLRLDFDLALVEGDDLVNESHADAVAFLAGGGASVEELEDVALLFGGHACAGVGEGDADIVRLGGDQDVGGVVGGVLAVVLYQVLQGNVHQVFVAIDAEIGVCFYCFFVNYELDTLLESH